LNEQVEEAAKADTEAKSIRPWMYKKVAIEDEGGRRKGEQTRASLPRMEGGKQEKSKEEDAIG
jgi:hypothetical protein